DLTTALDTQTATSDILHVISQSPTDAKPVLHAIVESAVRLVSGQNSVLFRLIAGEAHVVAQSGLSRDSLTTFQSWYPGPLTGLLETAVVSRQPVHTADMLTDHRATELGWRLAQSQGHRAILFVPLLQGDIVIGVLSVSKSAPLPFTDSQIALLQTFADQAVIAIENVRLFTELEARNRDLTSALEQQTATSDVLRIIAESPAELQPMLDAIATSALRLCAASDVVIERLEGDRFYNAAHAGTQMKGLVRHPLPLTRRFPGWRPVLHPRPIIIDDMMLVAESEYPDTLELLKLNTVHSCAEIPLLSEGRSLGNLAVLRAEVRPFTDAEIALLQTFADQAVIAIENVRLFKELEARNAELTDTLARQTATGDVLRAISRAQTDAQ